MERLQLTDPLSSDINALLLSPRCGIAARAPTDLRSGRELDRGVVGVDGGFMIAGGGGGGEWEGERVKESGLPDGLAGCCGCGWCESPSMPYIGENCSLLIEDDLGGWMHSC